MAAREAPWLDDWGYDSMKKLLKIALAGAAVLSISACGGSESDPVGQVAATVDGEEITVAELNQELGGVTSSDPQAQKQLRQAALQAIVNRTLVAKAAQEQGLTDTPDGALARRKAQQLADVALLEAKIRKGVPQPSDEEAQQFITDNPFLFANRKIYIVDQIVVPQAPSTLTGELEPLTTMDQIRAALTRLNIRSNETVGVIDALQTAPDAARQISNLPAGEVFIVPAGNTLRINRIREAQSQPVTGPDAIRVAKELLIARRVQGQLDATFQEIQEAGKSKIRYNPEFTPVEPAAKRPAGSPASKGGATAG